jgi:hypothetical protein
MLTWIAQTTIISIILIFLVHHLLNFFKSTLTIPKIKDLVNSPTQKYEDMYNIISNNKSDTSITRSSTTNANTSKNTFILKDDYTSIDLLPKPEIINNTKENVPNMKNELKDFLKKQMNNIDTNVAFLESYTNTSTTFSNF